MIKRIFFLAPYPVAEAPSQRFRFEQYFSFLQEEGFELTMLPFYNYEDWQLLYKEGNKLKKTWVVVRSFLSRFRLLFQLKKADFIFIHREVAHVGPPIFEWIIAKILRKKYIYDFDDATWLPNYSETNKQFHWIKAYWKVNYCMKWAHVVTAGNAYLANYAKQFNKNVQIIPTTIDTENHHDILCDHEADPIVIGWTGTHTTIHYLDELIPVLQRLEKKYSFEFLVISNEKPALELASFQFIKWQKETEIEDLSKIQIGVMPLKQDQWSEGKCGFKGLQYMALGMATILSPVGVNTTIIQDGENGFLADSQKEWEEKLSLLLNDNNLRKSMGKKGRMTVEDHFSVEANKSIYLGLFNSQATLN